MDRTERLYKIDQLLHSRKSTPLSVMMTELGVSRATVKRDLEYMRDRLHAPIVWDRQTRGYHFAKADHQAPAYELPGLWFNASELYALITMEHLLTELQPELLASHIAPLRSRIRMLLESGEYSADEVARRIRILHMAARPAEPAHFQLTAQGLLKRRRLRIQHYNRARDETTEREVSPQRLVYYRDNWYLDAWCHLRKGLRSFGLDAITGVDILPDKARNVADRTLDKVLQAGYGIFSGSKTRKAVLRFSPLRSRWVSQEQWHPKQEGYFDKSGNYILSFPYSNDTELILDILRYTPDVEVIRPASLRNKVKEQLKRGLDIYQE